MTTRRRAGGQVRAAATTDGQHTVDLQVIQTGVVDDYGSLWMADCFDASLAQRMPVLAWSHDWSDPIGVGLERIDAHSPDGPVVRFRFDDFDAVPRAHQAYAQVSAIPPTIQDCSVGFTDVVRRDPTDQERIDYPGVLEVMLSATLDETSLVLRGAVPGAKVMALRAAGADDRVPREQVALLMARLGTGELDLSEALNELKGLTPTDDDAGPDDDEDDDSGDADPPDDDAEQDADAEQLEAEVDALLAEADEALELVADRA